MKKQITNCPNCGAVLKHGKCEYCGTEVYVDPSYKIVVDNPGVVVLGASSLVDKDFMSAYGPDLMVHRVISDISRKFAEELSKYMNVVVEDDGKTNSTRVTARIRVVEPGVRF